MKCQIEHIFISQDHNFVGHFNSEPGQNPTIRKESVKLISGKGIEGDRYSIRESDHRKQITFFDMDVADKLTVHAKKPISPDSVRRNVFVRGLNLPDLVGKRFALQDIEFVGVDACPPCQWMDVAVGPGTKELLEGSGGLRARILNDGVLSVGEAELIVLEEGIEV
jgi:MOSC domain-containing protein YiiM